MDVMIRDSRSEESWKRSQAPAAWHDHEIEAPDQGMIDLEPEAPERRHGRHAEAPDAGEGRISTIDQEFTHGRSQS
jgi:hypothetical protein